MDDTEDEGLPPVPEIIAEINPLIEATEEEAGETVRVVIDLPKEWAILAGWLELIRLGRRHNPPRPGGGGVLFLLGATPSIPRQSLIIGLHGGIHLIERRQLALDFTGKELIFGLCASDDFRIGH